MGDPSNFKVSEISILMLFWSSFVTVRRVSRGQDFAQFTWQPKDYDILRGW